MAQLLQSNQNKYVPTIKCHGENIVLERIPLHGDQLFEERGRTVKWSFQGGDSDWDRIEGIEPEFADWHAKLNLYMVTIIN